LGRRLTLQLWWGEVGARSSSAADSRRRSARSSRRPRRRRSGSRGQCRARCPDAAVRVDELLERLQHLVV